MRILSEEKIYFSLFKKFFLYFQMNEFKMNHTKRWILITFRRLHVCPSFLKMNHEKLSRMILFVSVRLIMNHILYVTLVVKKLPMHSLY